MSLHALVEQTVHGLGYELVEVERAGVGLLRITIDHPWVAAAEERFITVEDCEAVTRQLQYALEVGEVDYHRLEVSSPGIDRPLRTENDFQRFVGHAIDLVLKAPIGEAGAGTVAQNRKKFRGELQAALPGETGWRILWTDVPAATPGKPGAVRKKSAEAPTQAMAFELSELREARLAPLVDFKGRRRNPGG